MPFTEISGVIMGIDPEVPFSVLLAIVSGNHLSLTTSPDGDILAYYQVDGRIYRLELDNNYLGVSEVPFAGF